MYRQKTQVEGDAAMRPAKEEVRRLLELLPDDASLEDIQYHIYVRQKILRGLEDIEAGRTLSEEEFEARMSKWLEP
jgi:predicted transcriptional regulator